MLLTVFGPKTTLGLVRFYSAGAVKQIAAVLERAAGQSRIPIDLWQRSRQHRVRGVQGTFEPVVAGVQAKPLPYAATGFVSQKPTTPYLPSKRQRLMRGITWRVARGSWMR